jgi:hypothetical protein
VHGRRLQEKLQPGLPDIDPDDLNLIIDRMLRLLVASLEDVIRSKEAAGRQKDRAVLPVLRDTVAVKRS